jgi:DNA-binding NarL/FixJ family response regulator
MHVVVDRSLALADEVLEDIESSHDLIATDYPANAEQAKHFATEHAPCVLLLGEQGFTNLVQQTGSGGKELGGDLKVLIFVREEPSDSGLKHLLAGCSGMLKEDTPAATVSQAIRAVLRDEFWFPRRAMAEFLRTLLGRHSGPLFTPREVDILGLVADGHKNDDIAKKLFISRDTVRWHLRRLYSKCGTSDRQRLARIAKSAQAPAT